MLLPPGNLVAAKVGACTTPVISTDDDDRQCTPWSTATTSGFTHEIKENDCHRHRQKTERQ